jgi:hypothetical protein
MQLRPRRRLEKREHLSVAGDDPRRDRPGPEIRAVIAAVNAALAEATKR